MDYNAKNYTEQGGEKTVIGGTVEIKEGAVIIGLPKAENQEDSTATTVENLKADFNDLLDKLKAAHIMDEDIELEPQSEGAMKTEKIHPKASKNKCRLIVY